VLSRLDDQVILLAQRVALLEQRVIAPRGGALPAEGEHEQER
jgi:hypothetical protein